MDLCSEPQSLFADRRISELRSNERMSFPFDPMERPQPQKKVRFAPFTQVFRDIPWECGSADPVFGNKDVLIPSDLQDSVDGLGTTTNSGDTVTVASVFLLVVCLAVLFFMVWFVARKILMLEADTEIDRQATRRALKFR
jgi:hypothetical protein